MLTILWAVLNASSVFKASTVLSCSVLSSGQPGTGQRSTLASSWRPCSANQAKIRDGEAPGFTKILIRPGFWAPPLPILPESFPCPPGSLFDPPDRGQTLPWLRCVWSWAARGHVERKASPGCSPGLSSQGSTHGGRLTLTAFFLKTPPSAWTAQRRRHEQQEEMKRNTSWWDVFFSHAFEP